MNDEHQKLFIDDFVALSVLYQDVKDILILAENINNEQSLLLGPINELRNALDHVMRAFLNYNENPLKAKSEIPKIREHLLRAGYDGYEIIATTLIEKIQKSPIKEFETEIITKIFPDYFSKYKRELTAIIIALKDVRANKTPDKILEKTPNNDFNDYLVQIKNLLGISDTIFEYIPELQNAQSLKDSQKQDDRKWDLKKLSIVALFVAALALIGNSIVKSCVNDTSKQVNSLDSTNRLK
jgi:hypothetical protein